MSTHGHPVTCTPNHKYTIMNRPRVLWAAVITKVVSNPDPSLFRSAGCIAGDAIHPALQRVRDYCQSTFLWGAHLPPDIMNTHFTHIHIRTLVDRECPFGCVAVPASRSYPARGKIATYRASTYYPRMMIFPLLAFSVVSCL